MFILLLVLELINLPLSLRKAVSSEAAADSVGMYSSRRLHAGNDRFTGFAACL